MSHVVSPHAQGVQFLVFDLHLCSRMRSFVFYYIMFIVCCQVFVTCFLKVFLRKFFVVVSIGAFVFGGVSGFCWVCDRGFSRLGPLAWRVWGCGVWSRCLYRVGCVRWLQGLLGVWWVSHWCGLR